MYQALQYQESANLAILSLNRPRQENRLNELLIVELKDALRRAEEAEQVRVIVLQGSHGNFCAGWDSAYLQQMLGFNMNEHIADSAAFGDLLLSMYRSAKLIIGSLEGKAMGPGGALISICDWVYAAEGSQVGFDEIKLGHAPAMILPFLLRKLPENRVKELVLGGRAVSAQKAMQFGLINEVFPVEELSAKVFALTQEICEENAAAPLQLSKKMIADLQNMPLENAMRFATKMNAYARTTDYFRVGVQAAAEGKKPKW